MLRTLYARATLLVAALATTLGMLATPGVAHADPVVVPAFPCAVIFGGSTTVPAGSRVLVRQAWGAKNRGLVRQFLQAQTTTITVNGGAPVDLSRAYLPLKAVPAGYVTAVQYDTGITLGVGDHLTFILSFATSHRVLDGLTLQDEQSHRPAFFGPGVIFTFPCTVAGV